MRPQWTSWHSDQDLIKPVHGNGFVWQTLVHINLRLVITTAERHFLWLNLIVLWFRRTAPCLATSAWQRLLSGGNCYPGLPNTVYTQWSILRHARPPRSVSIHWGFHDVYSVYTGVSLNKTPMNARSPENWWTRLDFGPQSRTLGILGHFDPSEVNKT